MKNIWKKIKEIYTQDGKTFAYHLASVGISTIAGAVTAGCLEGQGCNVQTNSSLTTLVGTGTYWTPFIGMLALNERDSMKNEQGKYESKKICSRIVKYASFIGIGEILYAGIRGVVQYQLQKNCDLDASYASALTDLTCATAYGVLVPPISHILRRVSGESKLERIASQSPEVKDGEL